MNVEVLRNFLLDSNAAGYAGGDSKKYVKEPDGSTTIPFEQGEWKSHDNFFGGEPYGGRIVVFQNDKAVWMIVYYGWVIENAEANQVYETLREALKQMPPEHPYRGPKRYESGNSVYTNNWAGELERFSGEEKITHGKKLVYKANYLGGLVDTRQGI